MHTWFTNTSMEDLRESFCTVSVPSQWALVTSAVAQGSIFGPTLFVAVTDDLTSVLSEGTICVDDTKIFRFISSAADRGRAQRPLKCYCDQK